MKFRQISSKRGIRREPKQTRFESLEGRCLLADGASSAIVGDALFYVSEDRRSLWRSDLDGTNAVLLQTWIVERGPLWLTAVGDLLYFSAGGFPITNTRSGRELWKSNGTAAGTTLVRDIYPGLAASEPHDFVEVNDRLVFVAHGTSHYSLYTTDGTQAGTIPLFGRSPVRTPHTLRLMGDWVSVEYDDPLSYQKEWWRTDGTVAGTYLLTSARVSEAGVLEVFGGAGPSTTLITANGVMIDVTVDGMLHSFPATGLVGIEYWGQQGDDVLVIEPQVKLPASIYGNAGNDSLAGGSGDDWIEDRFGRNLLSGGGGNDALQITGGGQSELNTLVGGEGDDALIVTHNAYMSLLTGGAGDDTIESGWGPNTIDGGAGNDSLVGEGADDSISGGEGNDFIFGDLGEDTLASGPGTDTVMAGPGFDSIVADADDVVDDPPALFPNGPYGLEIDGTHGDDIILVRPKANDPGKIEVVVNGTVTEFLPADIPASRVYIATGAGNDRITLDAALPLWGTFIGGAGDDTITGGSYDDRLIPGSGNDQVDGGGGAGDELSYRWEMRRLLKTNVTQALIRMDDGEFDTFRSVEVVQLGYGDDIFASDRAHNGIRALYGGPGSDVLMLISTQGMPPATIHGDGGTDTLIGSTDDSISSPGPDLVIRQAPLPPPPPPPRGTRPPIRVVALVI